MARSSPARRSTLDSKLGKFLRRNISLLDQLDGVLHDRHGGPQDMNHGQHKAALNRRQLFHLRLDPRQPAQLFLEVL